MHKIISRNGSNRTLSIFTQVELLPQSCIYLTNLSLKMMKSQHSFRHRSIDKIHFLNLWKTVWVLRIIIKVAPKPKSQHKVRKENYKSLIHKSKAKMRLIRFKILSQREFPIIKTIMTSTLKEIK